MAAGEMDQHYARGDVIVREGDKGDFMYVILEGQAEVVLIRDAVTRRLAILNRGDFFGEMDLFDPGVRSATVRAMEPTRVLIVDKKTVLRSLQEDPELALHFLRTLARRMRREGE